MKGDKFAAGATSGVLPAMPIKFNEGQMRDDLKQLPSEEFILKYMITQREYDLMVAGSEEKISSFAEEMKERAQLYERQSAAEKAQEEAAEHRECFLTPFVATDLVGRVIVSRDNPKAKKGQSALLLPKSLRKEKEMLPTTGHIIKATILATRVEPNTGQSRVEDVSSHYIGWRVLFSPMSGTAICFKGYPTWIQLELSEILCTVLREDVQLEQEDLEPMI
jgi:hypothetical protein